MTKAPLGARATPPLRIDAVLLLSSTRARLNIGEASGRVARRQRTPRIEKVAIKLGAGSSSTDARTTRATTSNRRSSRVFGADPNVTAGGEDGIRTHDTP